MTYVPPEMGLPIPAESRAHVTEVSGRRLGLFLDHREEKVRVMVDAVSDAMQKGDAKAAVRHARKLPATLGEARQIVAWLAEDARIGRARARAAFASGYMGPGL